MGILWYFQFVIQTAYNTDILPKYNTFKKRLNSIIKALINCIVCPLDKFSFFFFFLMKKKMKT